MLNITELLTTKGEITYHHEKPYQNKWVSDAYPEVLGQLDQYVVFRTKSRAIQDFQSGKRALFGVILILT